MYYGSQPKQQDCRVSGWARTGLEHEVHIGINTIGVDEFIGTGSTWSMIDTTFCMFLQLPVNSFHMYHVFNAGAELDHMACATIPLKGWVEAELNVPGSAIVPAKFWLVDIMIPKAINVVIGSHLLKEIYEKADQTRIKEWPTHWKELFE